MKALLTAFAITLSIGQSLAQDPLSNPTSAQVTNDVNTRLLKLEQSIKEASEAAEHLRVKNTMEKYENSLLLIRLGLENGSRIEDIVPTTMKLLALTDVTKILTDINNPTSNTLGSSFTDMAIQSAAHNLLPEYSTQEENQKAESKFTKVMGAIFNNPIVQSIANTNPITSTINSVIQQAGLFQNRASAIKLTKEQLKDKKDLLLPVNFQDPDGPAFDEKKLNLFYDDIKDRVNFYAKLNALNVQHADTIKRLYTDAKVIKNAARVSKSAICNILGIDSKDYNLGLNSKYVVKEVNAMKTLLKDENFNKALVLSTYAQQQLPEVLDFNKNVSHAVSSYIDGYIDILEEFKNKPNTKFKSTNVENTIALLKAHKQTFN